MGIRLVLDPHPAIFDPGQPCRLQIQGDAKVQSLTWALVWIAEGDAGSVAHATYRQDLDSMVDFPLFFDLIMPCSPLSFDGTEFAIRWVIRAECHSSNGETLQAELHFRLSNPSS